MYQAAYLYRNRVIKCIDPMSIFFWKYRLHIHIENWDILKLESAIIRNLYKQAAIDKGISKSKFRTPWILTNKKTLFPKIQSISRALKAGYVGLNFKSRVEYLTVLIITYKFNNV